MKIIIPVLTSLAVLTGCSPPSDGNNGRQSERVPQNLCDISRDSLDEAVALGQGTVTYDLDGNATMLRSSWEMIPWDAKMGMAKMLAYVAACSKGSDPNAEFIYVRDSMSNKVLAKGFYSSFNEE